MSIDARVDCVYHNEDGSGRLALVNRPERHGWRPAGIAGQKSLSYKSAPHTVTSLNGCDIWGSAETIMLGDSKIADRVGYTGIEFVDDEAFKSACMKYHARPYKAGGE